MEYLTRITKKALQKLKTNGSLDIAYAAYGDANGTPYVPDGNETQLVNQVDRINLTPGDIENGGTRFLTVHAVVTHNHKPCTVREAGLYDLDGDLCFITNIPASVKTNLSEIDIEFDVDIIDGHDVNFIIDPNMNFAKISYVDASIAAHKVDPAAHDQYATNTYNFVDSDNLNIVIGAINMITEHVQIQLPVIPNNKWFAVVVADSVDLDSGDVVLVPPAEEKINSGGQQFDKAKIVGNMVEVRFCRKDGEYRA